MLFLASLVHSVNLKLFWNSSRSCSAWALFPVGNPRISGAASSRRILSVWAKSSRIDSGSGCSLIRCSEFWSALRKTTWNLMAPSAVASRILAVPPDRALHSPAQLLIWLKFLQCFRLALKRTGFPIFLIAVNPLPTAVPDSRSCRRNSGAAGSFGYFSLTFGYGIIYGLIF